MTRPGRPLAHSYYDEIEAYRNRRPVADTRIPPVRLLNFVLSMVVLYIAIGGWVLHLLGVIR